MKSIIQTDTSRCAICGQRAELHHIFFGVSNRKLSDDYGLTIGLCETHHRGTRGVHGREGKELNLKLKRIAQKAFEERYGTREGFIKTFGKSYL